MKTSTKTNDDDDFTACKEKDYGYSSSEMISGAKTEAGAAGGNGGSSMTEKRRPGLPAT